MNTFEQLKSAMKGKKAVSVRNSILGPTVRHYDTDIFAPRNGAVKISSGGLYSVTTKRHINNCFAALGMNASVYQRKNVWYVESAGLEQVFFDGMFVNW